MEIARSFFAEWGLPFVEAEWPEIATRLAAGRLSGSDVISGDDAISRNHNWGPQFTIFLSAADFATHGATLAESMNAAAPKEWKGYRVAGGGDKNVLVESISAYFGKIGLSSPPRLPREWPVGNFESHLYFIRHGAVWIDRSGELSHWRSVLHQYPEQIHYARLAEECFRVWHHGEYNFVQRIARRKDTLARTIGLGEFTAGLMRMVFLLNRDYAPYWKWLGHQFRRLPEAAGYLPELEQLSVSSNWDEQVELIKSLSARLHTQILASGLIEGKNPNEWLLPLLNDHLELKERKVALEVKSSGE